MYFVLLFIKYNLCGADYYFDDIKPTESDSCTVRFYGNGGVIY